MDRQKRDRNETGTRQDRNETETRQKRDRNEVETRRVEPRMSIMARIAGGVAQVRPRKLIEMAGDIA